MIACRAAHSAVAFALAVIAAPALAEDATSDTNSQCVASFDRAQVLRREGRFLAARRDLVVCALPDCLDAVEEKCGEWLNELDAAIPTIVVVVPAGVEPSTLRVNIDGRDEPMAASGRPIALDPGRHEIRFERAGRVDREAVVMVEGEKNRRVEVPVAAAELPDGSGISPLVWVGFGVAAAGVIVGAVTGGLALAREDELAEACPNKLCSEDQRDDFESGQTLAHVSTVSFAVAGAGAIVGIVALAIDLTRSDEVGLVLAPGAVALRGRFR
jgi:hypothetical protein